MTHKKSKLEKEFADRENLKRKCFEDQRDDAIKAAI